jgi:hypothetical protein
LLQTNVAAVIKKACQRVKLAKVVGEAAAAIGNTTVAFTKVNLKIAAIIDSITVDANYKEATQPANLINVLLQENAAILGDLNVAFLNYCTTKNLAKKTT